jgi:hypothetical protein
VGSFQFYVFATITYKRYTPSRRSSDLNSPKL